MLARQTRHLFGKHVVHFVILNFESAMDENNASLRSEGCIETFLQSFQ